MAPNACMPGDWGSWRDCATLSADLATGGAVMVSSLAKSRARVLHREGVGLDPDLDRYVLPEREVMDTSGRRSSRRGDGYYRRGWWVGKRTGKWRRKSRDCCGGVYARQAAGRPPLPCRNTQRATAANLRWRERCLAAKVGLPTVGRSSIDGWLANRSSVDPASKVGLPTEARSIQRAKVGGRQEARTPDLRVANGSKRRK